MKKLRKNKKGFTLVELVVVIAILAILASTATVATIAILNNARKTPVSDAASSLKNQMQYYAETETEKDYPGTLAGFTSYLALSMNDIKVDNAAGTAVSAPSDDDIHVKVSTATNLRGTTWSCIVYTKYYKCTVTATYDTTAKGFTSFSVGGVEKI